MKLIKKRLNYLENQDNLDIYIKKISKYPLLTLEEEKELILKLQKFNDVEAARQLVCANLRLVVKIAMEYHTIYNNIMDLIQEGNIGLMKAVSKFDLTKGAKLSYYASWWIRSYILKYILNNFRLVRIGTTQAQKKLFYRLMREKERLEAQGIDITPKLLANKFNVREKDITETSPRLLGSHNEISLQNFLNNEYKITYQDLLVDQTLLTDDYIAENELKELIKKGLNDFIKTLKEKELTIFQERLISENPKTLQEIADKFGLSSRERIRQIENVVIKKLRNHYKFLLEPVIEVSNRKSWFIKNK